MLYRTFFKSYTEKVWGVPCREISAEWGAQRIKGLSILKSLKHAVGQAVRAAAPATWPRNRPRLRSSNSFLYPKFGPGQMWETVAEEVIARGGRIITGAEVQQAATSTATESRTSRSAMPRPARRTLFSGDYFFSTMPVKELIASLDAPVPDNVARSADGLLYRDFITVGLLVDKLLVQRRSARARS